MSTNSSVLPPPALLLCPSLSLFSPPPPSLCCPLPSSSLAYFPPLPALPHSKCLSLPEMVTAVTEDGMLQPDTDLPRPWLGEERERDFSISSMHRPILAAGNWEQGAGTGQGQREGERWFLMGVFNLFCPKCLNNGEIKGELVKNKHFCFSSFHVSY